MPVCKLYGDCASEIELFKGYEEERNALSGPDGTYYSLDRGENVHPVYNEPEPYAFTGPKIITFTIEFQESDNRSVSVRDEGLVVEYDATVTISRNAWESAFPTRTPKEGDVIGVFSRYFDVVGGGRSGNIVDTEEFVGWKLEVKEREHFEPDRKL